jgi:aminoglycoside phosphotransferase (APT) family kinase protein
VTGPAGDGHVERIRTALATVLGSTMAEELTLVSSPMVRSRSNLFFFGVGSQEPAYVVKVPVLGRAALDATPTVNSADQFRALTLAHEWFAEEDRHTAVRPVVYLEEFDAVVMEYVPGGPYRRTLRRGVLAPQPALRAAAAAGDALRRLHRHAWASQAPVDLPGLAAEVRQAEALALQPVGLRLPDEVGRVLDEVPKAEVLHDRVVMHGDFAPSNLILMDADQVVIIDPSLVDVGFPEDDLARFLAVMSSYSVFIPGLLLPRVRRLRRELESAFRSGYGAARTETAVMELRLLKQYALRWCRVREVSSLARYEQAMRGRQRVIDPHMRGLVTESARRLAILLSSDRIG